MKYLIGILAMMTLCLQALPAQSQAALEETAQTSKESDEWARKIENLIKLYSAEDRRPFITTEDVKEYSLQEMFKLAIELTDTSAIGEREAIFKLYKSKAVKANDARHIKLAHMFEIVEDTHYVENHDATIHLTRYTQDDDFFLSFLASNYRLQFTLGRLGGNMEIYSGYLDSYMRIRTLIPSPSHIHYEFYRYRDAIVSEHLMVLGGNIEAAAQAQQEAHYFAQKIGMNISYYDTVHNLILLHSTLYKDENSTKLAQKLYDATKDDEERTAFASFLLSNLLIKRGEFEKAATQLQKMESLTQPNASRVYYGLVFRSYLYSGNLEDAKSALDNYFRVMSASQNEIRNHNLTREFELLNQIHPTNRADAISFLAQNYGSATRLHRANWKTLTQSYIHSFGISHRYNETNLGALRETRLKTLPPAIKEQMDQILSIYKTPNILTENRTEGKNSNLFNSYIRHAKNTPNTATHYLQNSDFYQKLLVYDYSQALIFQHSKYSNSVPPKASPETSKDQGELLQIDIFEALHYMYMNDTKMAWQIVADIDAEIVNSEGKFAELEYQLEFLKFLLLTKERNLRLATHAAHNHIKKAIELKRPVNESPIFENFLYLLHQNNYFDEALALLDDVPRSSETDQYASINIEYLKAVLLTQTGQHAAALAHAQVHNGEGISDEYETSFQSLKYLNQAAMGDIKNAKILKQLISNKLSRISDITIQNITHLNMARAQTYLQTDNAAVYENNINTLATTLEQGKQIEIAKLRAERDQASLKKDILVRDHLNTLAGTTQEIRLHRNIAYFISAIFAFFMAVLGIIHLKRTQSLKRKITSLKQSQKGTEKIYQYLSSTSNERVSVVSRTLKSIKERHIDEATISSLSVAIDEADALLDDIKRTKVRSRLATSLDDIDYSTFDPHKFLSSMTPIWTQRIKSKNVTFTFNCDPKLGDFETDAEILIAAIEETVMKAIDTTLFGSITVEFNVSKKLSKHLLSINVTDTGDASQTFSPDDIAIQAIAALNGSLNHSCESGVGCNVKISLPIKVLGVQVKIPQNSNVITFKS